MTIEQRRQAAGNICNGFVRETFKRACSDMTAEQVQQWIYDNENSLPPGISAMLFAAHNACVSCGAYDHARQQAEFDGE
jgi:hypothetical protein